MDQTLGRDLPLGGLVGAPGVVTDDQALAPQQKGKRIAYDALVKVSRQRTEGQILLFSVSCLTVSCLLSTPIPLFIAGWVGSVQTRHATDDAF